MADLVPDNPEVSGKAPLVWSFTDNMKGALWVVCRYKKTTVAFGQALPPGVRKCSVEGRSGQGLQDPVVSDAMDLRKSRIKLLSLSVATTVVLLAIGAGLVVLGIFNEYLSWDIFSPPVKKVLWGVFSGPAFNWIQVIRDSQGKPRAALRILGNPTESYRDFEDIERGDP